MQRYSHVSSSRGYYNVIKACINWLGAPPLNRPRQDSDHGSCLLSSVSKMSNWSARDAGGRMLTLCICLDSPSFEFSGRSDYCGLFTKPASTTCSHSTPPASDKLSSLQIETNDLSLFLSLSLVVPLPNCLCLCQCICVCVCSRGESKKGREMVKSKRDQERGSITSWSQYVTEVDFIYPCLFE